MPSAPLPRDEVARLAALHKYAVLDTLPEAAFDDVVKLAASICGTPIALVSLVDESRQWFKARLGVEAPQTSRDMAFCTYAILQPGEVMVVSDLSLDPRFTDNPLVTGAAHVRFYAGAPLLSRDGLALGTLCVIDHEPHELSRQNREALATLARLVMAQLELRRVSCELGVANEHLRMLNLMDPLTELANRCALNQRLKEEMERTRRHDAPLCLLMLDIDHFRKYNDSFGHVLGDDVLCGFARTLKRGIRQSDLVARFGGDAFVVVLPETTEEGARLLAERYRERIEAASFQGRRMTTSVGVATWHSCFEHPEDFLEAADQALHLAKRNGRNRVEVARAAVVPHRVSLSQ